MSLQCQYILKPFPLRNRRIPFPSFLYHLQCPRLKGCLREKRLLGCVELFGEWSLVEFDILWLSKVVLGNFAQVCCILEHCRSHSHTLPLQQAVSFPLVHLLSKTGVFTKIKRLSAISGESLTALHVPTHGSEGPAHIQAQVVPPLQTNCWPQAVSGQEILLPVCVSIT